MSIKPTGLLRIARSSIAMVTLLFYEGSFQMFRFFENFYGTELLIAVAIFVPLEMLFAARPQKLLRRGLVTDFLFVLCNVWFVLAGIVVFLAAGIALIGWMIPVALKQWIGNLPFWAQVPLAILIADLGVYWTHRLMHVVPALWHFHAVHHSVEELDWVAAVHQHPVDLIVMKGGSILPLVLLGLSAEAIATYSAIFFWQSFLDHANVRINYGPLNYIFVSPEFHHWHHSQAHEARDKNFAGSLAFYDLLFRSIYLPKRKKPKLFGVDNPMPEGYFSLLAYPFLALRHARRTRP
ncbi:MULTISPECIES: sterol desaturase family protein [unclassified Bradyrhizobium]